jgi:hypothetical protein
VNVPRQTDFSLRISSSCSLGVGAFTSTKCVECRIKTPHLVGSAASIPHLEQDQRCRQQKYYWGRSASEEALLRHSVEDLFGNQLGVQR